MIMMPSPVRNISVSLLADFFRVGLKSVVGFYTSAFIKSFPVRGRDPDGDSVAEAGEWLQFYSEKTLEEWQRRGGL